MTPSLILLFSQNTDICTYISILLFRVRHKNISDFCVVTDKICLEQIRRSKCNDLHIILWSQNDCHRINLHSFHSFGNGPFCKCRSSCVFFCSVLGVFALFSFWYLTRWVATHVFLNKEVRFSQIIIQCEITNLTFSKSEHNVTSLLFLQCVSPI